MRPRIEAPTPAVDVVRRSSLSLRSGFVVALVVSALALAGDTIYRNEQANRLLAAVEQAESLLVSYQRDLGNGDTPDTDEVAADYLAAREAIAAFDAPGFYVALERTRDAYLLHADAWLESFHSPSDEAFDAVNSSWMTFCSTVGQVVPYLDYGAVDRSIVYLQARGGCPGD